ncbi:MAG: hypothetical protein Q8Q09_21365 [Deltaproteobacteria bacterium]|nr:hypothetical protein [Deltaproteobacteria bacterium]
MNLCKFTSGLLSLTLWACALPHATRAQSCTDAQVSDASREASIACASGALCGAQCVDLGRDPAHCGGCDQQCPGACLSGVCAPVSALAAGQSHRCALLSSGAVYCWGRNHHGQVGAAISQAESQPVRVVGLPPAVALFAHSDNTCAVSAEGKAWCWGRNDQGQLGLADRSDRSAPVPIALLGVREVRGGEGFMCARDRWRQVWCWGANDEGQLGDSTRTSREFAAQPRELSDVVELGASTHGVCAVRADKLLYCWGRVRVDAWHYAISGAPARWATADAVEHIALGDDHLCMVHSDATVTCVGSNEFGQMSASPREDSFFARVEGVSGVRQIVAGSRHTCVVSEVGQAQCWGDNRQRQIADNSQAIVSLQGITDGAIVGAIALGDGHTCVLGDDGVRCLGGRADPALGALDESVSVRWP